MDFNPVLTMRLEAAAERARVHHPLLPVAPVRKRLFVRAWLVEHAHHPNGNLPGANGVVVYPMIVLSNRAKLHVKWAARRREKARLVHHMNNPKGPTLRERARARNSPFKTALNV